MVVRSALREVEQVLSAKLVAGCDRATFPAHEGREDVFVPSTHCSAGEKSAASLLPHDDVRLATRKTAVENRADLSRAAATERARHHHLLTRKTNIPCRPNDTRSAGFGPTLRLYPRSERGLLPSWRGRL